MGYGTLGSGDAALDRQAALERQQALLDAETQRQQALLDAQTADNETSRIAVRAIRVGLNNIDTSLQNLGVMTNRMMLALERIAAAQERAFPIPP